MMAQLRNEPGFIYSPRSSTHQKAMEALENSRVKAFGHRLWLNRQNFSGHWVIGVCRLLDPCHIDPVRL